METVIIDYGMGNLLSVQRAFEKCGSDAVIIDNPLDLREAEHIVLPGVGAFPDAMNNLREQTQKRINENFIGREGDKFIGVSKSTTFLDLKYRFKEFLNEPTIVKFNIILDSDSPYLSDNFYKLVSDKMMTNFNNKYYTGGEATKRLWKLRKENTYGKIAKN